jgi:hypothetical protein
MMQIQPPYVARDVFVNLANMTAEFRNAFSVAGKRNHKGSRFNRTNVPDRKKGRRMAIRITTIDNSMYFDDCPIGLSLNIPAIKTIHMINV